MTERRLLVRIDGELMPEAEAHEFWKRFSDHMDKNRGDLAGFAAREGLKSVHPSVEKGSAVLIASHSEAQMPYTNASAANPVETGRGAQRRSSAGSPKNQPRAEHPAKKR